MKVKTQKSLAPETDNRTIIKAYSYTTEELISWKLKSQIWFSVCGCKFSEVQVEK